MSIVWKDRNDLFTNILKSNVHFDSYSPTKQFIWLNTNEDPYVVKAALNARIILLVIKYNY